MQRLLAHKLASSLLQNTATSSSSALLLHSVPHKKFSSVTKTPRLNQLLNFPPTHPFHRCIPLPWRSQHTLAGAIPRFLSIPVVANRFLANFSITHFRILSKSISDCRVWFLRRRPDFSRNFRYQNSGWRSSWFQQLTANDMVLGLLVSNVAVFLLWRIADQKFMMNNFTISVENFKSGRLHTLITSAFSHIDIEHIVSNMIGLYFFGISIGNTFGPQYLLKLYLAGAIGGSVFYLVHHAYLALASKGHREWRMDPSKTPGLGASGAVNAIMLLNIFLNPMATLYFDFIIPVPAMLLGVFLIGKDLWRMTEGNSHISGSAHLGGAAVAAIAWARIRRGRF
ncbi:hypothetical protein SLA2020_003250 [Shorea laevis]